MADYAPTFPAPLQSVSILAWLGGWDALRSPAVPAPTADGESTGDLEGAFRVEWSRKGESLRARITKLADAWVGRLALDLRFAPDSAEVVFGCNDVPVRLPMDRASKGQVVWVWSYGIPSWITATQGGSSGGATIDSATTHGYFVDRYPDGTIVASICMDWPKEAGQSVEIPLRLVTGMSPEALQAERRQRLGAEVDPPVDTDRLERLRAEGFVRVDAAGTGFETADGRPVRILGQNTPHLAELSPAEQERILAQSEAAGITVTRFLVPDYLHRPLGATNEEAYRRLLATIDRCAAHGIRSIICLEYSGCGQQYNLTIHRTPSWSDLYFMPEALEWYRETIERVVVPLRDNPAVLAYDVSNEPDMALSPASDTQSGAWHAWLAARYGAVDRLRAAWAAPDLASFDTAPTPAQEDYDWQRTQAARDFLSFGGDAVGRAMIARANLVRAADPNHLITLSAWDPRLLRGLRGAEVFDYWSPHSYEIYFVGPEIDDQVAYQVGALRRALPDRPRPVVIEEFGLFEDPKFPEPMRAEHCRAFLQAGERWGTGMMIWYDLTAGLQAEFAAASQRTPAPLSTPAGRIAFYIPPSEECRVLIYPMYMWRRKWGMALATAGEAGYETREAVRAEDATGSRAVLVLADALTPDEEAAVRGMGQPVILMPGADALKQRFAEATVLPDGRDAQVAQWRERTGP